MTAWKRQKIVNQFLFLWQECVRWNDLRQRMPKLTWWKNKTFIKLLLTDVISSFFRITWKEMYGFRRDLFTLFFIFLSTSFAMTLSTRTDNFYYRTRRRNIGPREVKMFKVKFTYNCLKNKWICGFYFCWIDNTYEHPEFLQISNNLLRIESYIFLIIMIKKESTCHPRWRSEEHRVWKTWPICLGYSLFKTWYENINVFILIS